MARALAFDKGIKLASHKKSRKEKRSGERVKAAGILLMLPSQENIEFLLMRHRHRWDLPKGHCEPGETFRQTALRETEEETGISPAEITLDDNFVFELVYPVTYPRQGDQTFQKQVRYFLGYLREKPKLEISEHESAQWFDWNPPHQIQPQTIDPLLAAVADYWIDKKESAENQL